MPTYEFRCEAGHTTDRFFRSMGTAQAVITCPECGADAVRQVSGGIGIVFKGSGFYITDYGKDGKKPRTMEKADSSKEPGDTRDSVKSAPGSASGDSAGGSSSAESKTASSAKPDSGSSSKKPSSE